MSNELDSVHLLLIGFLSFPIAKWLTIAIWDKIMLDCEKDIDDMLENKEK